MDAQSLQKVPVLFTVKNVFLSDHAEKSAASVVQNTEHAPNSLLPVAFIAITYDITIIDMTRKFTLVNNREIRLTDEFGNQYRRLPKPVNYIHPVVRMPDNFPSLYPGDIYSETAFFETPVKAARSLTISFNAADMGINKPIDLFIDIADRTSLRSPPKKPINPATLDIRIVDPQNGTILSQGDVIHVRVVTAGEKPPRKIIVIALNTYFEDKSPHYENVYDFNVPLDQKPGNYVLNVIAEWAGADPEHNITLSDTLSFDVQEATPVSSL